MSKAQEKTWISANAAAHLLGVDVGTFRRAVAESKAVTVRHYPGTQPRYLRSDVLGLAERSVIPAISA